MLAFAGLMRVLPKAAPVGCPAVLRPSCRSLRASLVCKSGEKAASDEEGRPPYPPFNAETAAAKVQAAEDAWNTRDPKRVSLAYTRDSVWRNRAEFFQGRDRIVDFLTRKWNRELDYKLKKQLFCFAGNRIAVTFQYEYRDDSGNWFRAYGNENWEFADNGLMRHRQASINDVPIKESERTFR